MTSPLNRVSKAHLRYKLNRGKIKAKHRKMLEEENLPDLIALGREIEEAKNSGYRIEEIMTALGIKNRNFLYDAWNSFKVTQSVPTDEESTKGEVDSDLDYTVVLEKRNNHSVSVKLTRGFEDPEEHTLTVNEHGQIVDMPVEWLDNPTRERKLAVQGVIKRTAELFAQ